MLKEKKYNEELRSRVLICSIRAEDSASEILISLLRRVRPDSKTLGNKSSSLSFKNKIDLLYDIDDLSKEEYTSMLKFMEIRNQFIHNGSCNSFLDLAAQYPEIKTYLKKFHPNDQEDEETGLEKSFGELFISVLCKLLILKIEYRKGATAEMDRFIDAQAFKNIGNAYQTALKTFNASVYNTNLSTSLLVCPPIPKKTSKYSKAI
jgi:hypothetical protein